MRRYFMENPLIKIVKYEFNPLVVGIRYENPIIQEYFKKLKSSGETQVRFKHSQDVSDCKIYCYNLESIFKTILWDLSRVCEYKPKSWAWKLRNGSLRLDTEWVHYSDLLDENSKWFYNHRYDYNGALR